ncbi:MAG TPA: glucose-6-phosphate dehydrogenase assembly protein OpcA [Candidatus Dormibacteraeota bacterium]|nr:glucose-6-phosphate dehydrogenase assembly protein OpcA [Candidatus Dormibacteraeota bacterium]
MAKTLTELDPDRVRTARWEARDTDLDTVMAKVRDLHAELGQDDAAAEEHPHPRNCVLNLVVGLGDKHRAEQCDKLVGNLAASHPLRAILVHLHGGAGPGTLDAEITCEAHRLLDGTSVQREQILLHVRGEVTRHLSSLVEPLLVADVPTYLWWSGRGRLDDATVRDVMSFCDVLVVDSAQFEHPVGALLQLAALASDPQADIGVGDFRWGRLRPWRDAIGQFFAPADRQALLGGIGEIDVTSAGTGGDSRVGAALLAGWAAHALGWRFGRVDPAGADGTDAVLDAGDGQEVRLRVRSVANQRLHHGELLTVRIAGRSGRRAFTLLIERDPEGDGHAHVTIELGNAPPLHQRLTLPRIGDPDLLVHVLWAQVRDPMFYGALLAAMPLLEALR